MQRPQAPPPSESMWADQPDDPWAGRQAPAVPGWGEDAVPRSRRSRNAPPPYADPMQPGRYGAADEPTWASASLGLSSAPASAPGWTDAGEPTWGGAPAASPYAPAPPVAEPAPRYPAPEPPYPATARPVPPPAAPPPAPSPRPAASPRGGGAARLADHDTAVPVPREPGPAYSAPPQRVPAPGPREGSDSWRQRAAEAATPFRRRKGGVNRRFGKAPVIGVVMLFLLALLGGAGYWYFLASGGAGAEQRALPELSVSGLLDELEQEGFECTPGRTIALCEKSIEGADLSVTVHFADETEVTMIEASGGTAAYAGDGAPPEQLRGFFEMAAALPLPDGSDAAGRAKAWVGEHIDKPGAETFDDVRYEFSVDQQLLTMRPA